MIIWPAMIKYSQHDELSYLRNADEMLDQQDDILFEADEFALLIDSSAAIYSLNSDDNKGIKCVITDKVMPLDNATKMIQAHFSLLGLCCVSKIHARSMADLIDLVAQPHI